jgi:divalent metal cation (Fe/Co/Zn/Cd) transporter
MDSIAIKTNNESRLFKIAFALAVFTILYNLVEGVVSVYFGFEDESLTLFGFGVDSFIEVISGVGIAVMVLRIQSNVSNRTNFERTSLRITGVAFYILVAGLVVTASYNLYTGHKPETTFWGVVISIISIAVMWALIYGKITVGRKLKSEAILSDANCTKVCIYMSVILLVSSALYELTNIMYVDAVGTFGLAYFSFKEGKECFEKAKSNTLCCGDCH